jgi:hypothetical protein
VNLIATVKVKSDGSPVTKGAVDYTQDLTVFGIANVNGSGKATLGVSAFPAGAYSFGASYADTSPITFASSEAAPLAVSVVKADTSMTLTTSANPVAPGSDFTLTAMLDVAAPADLDWFGGPRGSLQFTVDGRALGPPFPLEGDYGIEVTVTAPTVPGSAVLGVSYSGDDNSKPSSASLQWSVAQPPAPPPSGGTPTPPGGGTPTPPSALPGLNAMRTALATALRKGGLSALASTEQTFNAPGPGVLDQKVFTPTAPKSALKAKKPILIASASRKATAAGPITFKLKATPAGKRMLRKARTLKLAIVTRFTPTADTPVVVVSRLTVKKKAKRSATATLEWHGWRVVRLDR